MTVYNRKKRRITYKGRQYFLYVRQNKIFDRATLNIISDDKRMMLMYPFDSDDVYVISRKANIKCQKVNEKWKKYFIPFEKTSMTTKEFVFKLVEWVENITDA